MGGGRGGRWRGRRGTGPDPGRQTRGLLGWAGAREGGRRKGGGRVRVRQASGGQGAGFVLLFPVCRLLGPLCRSWTPHPHPGGSRTGRARLPRALSQEGLGAEWERTAVRGSIDLASPLAASLPPIAGKPRILGQDHSCPCQSCASLSAPPPRSGLQRPVWSPTTRCP